MMLRRVAPPLFALLLGIVLVRALAQPEAAPRVPAAAAAESLNLDGRLGEIELIQEGGRLSVFYDGQTWTAEEYLALVAWQQQRRDEGGPIFHLFNITSLGGIVWVSLGLLGQLLFTGRMLVQWLVSEKQQRSVVPPIFWYLSLGGAILLLIYFGWRKDVVGILGQATGFFIYLRNIYLIYARHKPAAQSPIPNDSLPTEAEINHR